MSISKSILSVTVVLVLASFGDSYERAAATASFTMPLGTFRDFSVRGKMPIQMNYGGQYFVPQEGRTTRWTHNDARFNINLRR
jgi:hypothetical protein